MKTEIFEALDKGATISEIERWFGISNAEAFSYICEWQEIELNK